MSVQPTSHHTRGNLKETVNVNNGRTHAIDWRKTHRTRCWENKELVNRTKHQSQHPLVAALRFQDVLVSIAIRVGVPYLFVFFSPFKMVAKGRCGRWCDPDELG